MATTHVYRSEDPLDFSVIAGQEVVIIYHNPAPGTQMCVMRRVPESSFARMR